MTQMDIKYGNMSLLKLSKFKINKMVDHCTIAMIAKRATGKSYLTKEILYHKRKLASAIVISLTEKLNKFYGEFIPSSYIYDKFDTEILSRMFIRQKKMILDNDERKKKGKPLKDTTLMLVMDDCMSDKKWVKDPNIGELFFNGRHYHVSLILTMQYAVGIPPEMRSNLDYIFLLAEDFTNNQKKLYEHYAGMFPTLDSFKQVFSHVTSNYGVMVINNRIHSSNLTDKVFWYKAREVPKFRLGSNKYYKYNKRHYDQDWDKRTPEFNTNDLLAKKKNRVNFKIKRIK